MYIYFHSILPPYVSFHDKVKWGCINSDYAEPGQDLYEQKARASLSRFCLLRVVLKASAVSFQELTFDPFTFYALIIHKFSSGGLW